MRDYFKTKTWLITVLMLVMAFSLSTAFVYYEFIFKKNIKFTSAGINDNIFDWAWNSNIGWISFNCASNVDTTGDGLGDQALKICDGGANQNKVCNTKADGIPIPGAFVCSGANCVSACSVHDYGVGIDSSGNFSGYAWSSNVGWISFDRSETGNPPGQPYQSGTFIADYNKGNDQVRGWAKILSMGDDGWIKLRKFGSDGGPDYGVSIEPASGELNGWAWNANNNGAGIGWISFNCSNDNSCGGVNYKVVKNTPPEAIDLTAPNLSYSQASLSPGALSITLNWDFKDIDLGNTQSRYRIIADDDSNPADPIFDSGKCLGFEKCDPASACGLNDNKCHVQQGTDIGDTTIFPLSQADGLEYNTSYYWWVQTWDNHNVASPLTQFDTRISGHVLNGENTADNTANNPGDPYLTFTTYKHEFPDAGFTCFPEKPSKGEKVRCTANSQRYFSAAAVACTPATCDWFWTLPGGASFASGFSDNNAATSTPIIIFNSSGLNNLNLKVTDKTDTGNPAYYTEFDKDLTVILKLPKWKEVKVE